MSLRGHAVVLMGKNTMMRKAIRGHLGQNPKLEQLLPHIVGNVGFVFTKEELVSVRDMLLANKVKAPARAGAIAPLDVTVPAQNTGLGPEKTSFFQALNIPTKITKGTIEIIQNVHLIKTGDKVGMSEATLLNMLGISPFTYGLIVKKVYDGSREECCRHLFGHWLSHHSLCSSLHCKRNEKLHGYCCCHRHHFQRG